jgi:hypothetical protein
MGIKKRTYASSSTTPSSSSPLPLLLVLTSIMTAIVAVALVIISNMITPAVATTMTTDSNGTTTTIIPTTSSSSGIELSAQPVYQEHITNQVETPINQTHFQLTYSGNGTLTFPNSTETVKTISTGGGIVSMIDGSFVVKGILTSEEDRSENATATFYGIARFNIQDGSGRGIVIALIHTNSTDMLAPFDGMILTGQMELPPGEDRFITFWEWQSGIPYVKMQLQPMMQESPMNTTEIPPELASTPTNVRYPQEGT